MLIKFNRPSMLNFDESFKLIPGTQSVNHARWAEVRKHPMIKTMLNDGLIEEETEFEEPIAGAPEPTEEEQLEADLAALGAMKIPAAKAVVKETVDLNLLRGWAARETRDQVKKALEAQINAVEAPAEYREEGKVRQITANVPMIEMNAEAKPKAGDE